MAEKFLLISKDSQAIEMNIAETLAAAEAEAMEETIEKEEEKHLPFL
jgi:hypothetical protein